MSMKKSLLLVVVVILAVTVFQLMTSGAKIAWFLIAYILFDVSYTVLDAPAYALTTVMTSNVDERNSMIAGSKLCLDIL